MLKMTHIEIKIGNSIHKMITNSSGGSGDKGAGKAEDQLRISHISRVFTEASSSDKWSTGPSLLSDKSLVVFAQSSSRSSESGLLFFFLPAFLFVWSLHGLLAPTNKDSDWLFSGDALAPFGVETVDRVSIGFLKGLSGTGWGAHLEGLNVKCWLSGDCFKNVRFWAMIR